MMTRNPSVHILRQLVSIALPISAGRLLNILANFLAMMMVAQISKDQLAAGFLAVSSTMAITTSVLTIFYAVGIQVRYHRGQNCSPQSIGILVKNGFFLALILAIPAALMIGALDKLLLAIGQETGLVFLTRDYLYYAGPGVLPILLMTVIGQFFVGIGKPYFALIIEIISFPLTLISCYAMVLGHFGFTQLGLSGVSLANLCVQTTILIATLIFIFWSKDGSRYQLFKKPYLPSWPICLSILRLGLPIGIQFGGELIAMAVASYFMGYFGVDALAALQIASQYSVIVIMLNIGLTQALSLKVSEHYGLTQNKNNQHINNYISASVLLLTVYLMPITLLFLTCSTQLAQFYMGTDALRPDFEYLISGFFALSALFLILDGLRHILSGTLRGMHNSKAATQINLAAMWLISIPASWFAAFILKGGPIALRIGFLSGFIVSVGSLAMYLYKILTRTEHLSINTNHQDAHLRRT